MLGGLERMEERHPDDRSHWYLFAPGYRAGGAGTRVGLVLLAQMLARVDADGMPAYLESSNERNIALYGRHGFEITGEVAIPGGPRIWPMWREPELERVITEGSVRQAAASRAAINDAGRVVGRASDQGGPSALVPRLSAGTVRHLGTVESLATGVNEARPAIGRCKDSWLTDHPLAWDAAAGRDRPERRHLRRRRAVFEVWGVNDDAW